MDNFNYKKFLSEGKLLKENSPGFEDRKYGESLPTLKSIQSAYESKQISEEEEVAKAPKKEVKKPKKDSVDNKLAEIDKEGQIVALEAKIEAIDEMIESKNQRISMVTEDDNLSQLVDKKKMKEMQREVKDLERRKAKMEKLYEKMCGKSYTKEEIVDEEMSNELNESKTTMKKSELKEMIKKAMLSEDPITITNTTDAYDPLYEEDAYENRSEFDTNKPGRVGEFIKALDSLVDEYHAELYLNDEIFAAISAAKSAAEEEAGFGEYTGDSGIDRGNLARGLEDLEEVSLNASELETAIAALSGILGLPAVAYLSQLAQDKLEDIKSKLAEGDLEEGTWTRYEDMTDEEKEAFDSDMNEAEDVEVEDNEKVDVDIEKDVEVDDESVESDIEVKGSMPGEDADEVAVQSLLMKAQEEAAKLGDEKLTDQIGNTITYFTRAHVAQVDENKRLKRSKVRKSLKESKVKRGEDGLITKLL